MQFNKMNNVVGWLVFAIALTVYTLTLEPTVSFWDCGEFISACYKLQVVHPPGAPLFLIIGRFFTMFAGSPEKVAYMVNFMSGLCSAFTILFLFWTITAIGRKILAKEGALDNGSILALLGSGVVGALAYTFSDSFWFSAVEGEVYAMSSFFTAIVFWAILKWDRVADEPDANRWLILIAYLMGLSVGVHLLNLLCIPAIGLVYYFRKYKPSRNGLIFAIILSIIVLAFVQWGIIPGIPKLTAFFDRMFVNGFGLPFGSGAIFGVVLVIAGVVLGLRYATKKGMVALHTSLLAFAFIVLGYSSYIYVVIRSNANPVIDMNNPEDPNSLLSYLSREQYGSVPFLYGPYFTAEMVDQKVGAMKYYKDEKNHKYQEAGRDIEPIYDPKQSTYFPRMYNRPGMEQRKKDFYKMWEQLPDGQKPRFSQNLHFMFSYQLGHMWGRFFMWNFVGRQNDIQGQGLDPENGNWISGIPAIDNRLGDQQNLPDSMRLNKGKNKYYFLPFILGVLGLLYHYRKSKQALTVVFSLFFLTGLAINLYLNPDPLQPRERDYAYVGSFYAFAIWIGFGVMFLFDLLKQKLNGPISALATTVLCLCAVPVLMAAQNWDDHDRSNKYTARDFAISYLESCAPNAILFTMGDNDTYPLWYAQEVEGIRTDVRIINLSLLGTDWYVNQLRHKTNNSEPIKLTMTEENIVQGTRDYVPVYDREIPGYVDLKQAIAFAASDAQENKVQSNAGEFMSYLPTKKFSIPVNKAEVLKNGTVQPEDSAMIVPEVDFELNRNGVYKNDLIVLDILANNMWQRPIYFTVSMGPDSYLGLQNYFQMDGLAYRFVPVKNPPLPEGEIGRIQTRVMADNFLNKFRWGNMETGKIYVDPESNRMTLNLKTGVIRLVDALLAQNDKAKAIQVLDYARKMMNEQYVVMNVLDFRMVEQYYAAGAAPKAVALSEKLFDMYYQNLNYYTSLKPAFRGAYERDSSQGLAIMQELIRLAQTNGQEKVAKTFSNKFSKFASMMNTQ